VVAEALEWVWSSFDNPGECMPAAQARAIECVLHSTLPDVLDAHTPQLGVVLAANMREALISSVR
jgi:hypothetical protein